MWPRRKRAERQLPVVPVVYPTGIVVRTEKATYLINRDGKRYRISSPRILDSWSFPLVVETSEVAVSKYPVAVTKLGFRDGSLLNNIADGKIYLVSGGKLRQVTSPDALDMLGVSKDDALLVSQSDINIMKVGEEIS